MMIFKNCNGTEYEVIAVCGFNKADREYYKHETHRVCAYALLQDIHGNCVVACGLNTMDWNNGIYFTTESVQANLEQAKVCFEEKVREYLGE